MSGGHFNYQQNSVNNIINSIEEELNNDEHSERMKEAMKVSIQKLKEAYIYAQRMDRYLSGDDGEETFFERLENDLKRN